MGFLPGPAALAPGLAINLEPCDPLLGPLLPGFPLFLLFTGNDISIFFRDEKLAVKLV